MRAVLLVTYSLVLILVINACKDPIEKVSRSADVTISDNIKTVSSSGHEAMVSRLKAISENADPANNYHLNRAKAQLAFDKFNAATDNQLKFQYALEYAQQSMYAGRTKEAAEMYANIMNRAGGQDIKLNPFFKQFFELVATNYLRQGELENCVKNHNDASCIFPLAEEALHTEKSGSQEAIKLLGKILAQYPDDSQVAYLKNIAETTLGQQPLAKYQKPSDKMPIWKNVATSMSLDHTGLAGGTIIDDFNNDGHLDIVASSYGYGNQIMYFENDANGSFDEKSKTANLTGITGGLNINQCDYNNDGNLDIYVMRGGWLGPGGNQPNSLLKGNGDGTFVDVTEEAGLLTERPTQTAVWADFDLDGNLDLFIGNETSSFDYGSGEEKYKKVDHPCQLFMNNGNGTFTEMAKEAGVDVSSFVKGITAGDINNDGFPDLYISVMGESNVLFLNNTKESASLSFSNGTNQAAVSSPKLSFPTWMWDYNNDGNLDIYVGGYNITNLQNVGGEYYDELLGKTSGINLPALYRNNGDGTFTNLAKDIGLRKSMYSMGCNFGDLNNDGYLDFYMGTGAPALTSVIPNRMFLNTNGNTFTEVSYNGFAHIQKGHGIGWGDLDNDGDQDIYAVQGGAYEGDKAQNVLFENPGNDNNWITLSLVGNQSNKAAIGAKVRVKSGNRYIYRTVSTGSSFGANSLQLEIGLGEAKALAAEVKWPVNGSDWISIGDLAANNAYKIIEGSEGSPERLSNKSTKFKKNNSGHKHDHHH